MNEKMAVLSQELTMANKVAEECQKSAHASEERANLAEAAQRAVMVSSPPLSSASKLLVSLSVCPMSLSVCLSVCPL
jgi:hypothetical protein